MKIVRALSCVAASLVAVPLLGVAPANAAKPVDRWVDHFDDVFVAEDFCHSGLPVDAHVQGSVTGRVTSTPSGAPLFFDNFVVQAELTVDDRTLSLSWAGPVRDVELVDNGDGTITLTNMAAGNYTTVKDVDGNVVWQQKGLQVLQAVIDLNGTPEDPSDDIFLSEEVLHSSGLIDDRDFCDVVLGYLYP